MGIYDEYRDSNAAIILSGNRKAAAAFIPVARKFAEVMQGKLDLGANLGQDNKDQVVIDDNTTMRVSLAEGVTNSMMQIEIISTLPPEALGKVGEEIKVTSDCPQLPLSRPGARMFTHMFGHDCLNRYGLSKNTFEQKNTVKTSTPYITPTLDQGAYCSSGGFPGTGDLWFHDEVSLAQPFQLMGKAFTRCYIHDTWLGIVAPQTFLSFSTAFMPLSMPCNDCNFQGQIFTPNPEQLGPGNNFALSMNKNPGYNSSFCYPNRSAENITFLVEGTVRIRTDDPSLDSKRTESEEEIEVKEDQEAGELRDFALISWAFGQGQAEIVLLYPSPKCPAAVGFFWDGADSLSQDEFQSGIIMSAACVLNPPSSTICLDVHPDTGVISVPLAQGGYFIGANRQSLAYTGCFNSRQTDRGATHNLGGRSFWFELDPSGFPNGNGIHNGPLLSDRTGAEDLTFNI